MSDPPHRDAMNDLESASRERLEMLARDLGLRPDDDLSDREMIAAIRRRQALLGELDAEALRDILRWAGRPETPALTKEQMARRIARIEKMRFEGLTHRGLVALARLRGIPAAADQTAEVIIGRIKGAETLGQLLRRKRRALIGSLISKVVSKAADADEPSEPDRAEAGPPGPRKNLRLDIEDEGVVGGLARRLRGAADDYVRQKLDEIEVRIDRKLDEIDRRLAEWRDREVATRLRIIKLTLLATVVVAFLSLGYSYLKSRSLSSHGGGKTTAPAARALDSNDSHP